MKTFVYELNKPQDFLEIKRNLANSKINTGDLIQLQVDAKSNLDFNISVSKIFNEPFVYCQLIDACRAAINSKKSIKEYSYPANYSIYSISAEIAKCLTQSTNLNFAIVRNGNDYSLNLPTSGKLNEIGHNVFSFFISNSIIPGDIVTLNKEIDKLNLISQIWYYHVIKSAINVVAEQNHLPAINLDFINDQIQESNYSNFNLADRLSKSGIKFSYSN
jgi:hypothetical protein